MGQQPALLLRTSEHVTCSSCMTGTVHCRVAVLATESSQTRAGSAGLQPALVKRQLRTGLSLQAVRQGRVAITVLRRRCVSPGRCTGARRPKLWIPFRASEWRQTTLNLPIACCLTAAEIIIASCLPKRSGSCPSVPENTVGCVSPLSHLFRTCASPVQRMEDVCSISLTLGAFGRSGVRTVQISAARLNVESRRQTRRTSPSWWSPAAMLASPSACWPSRGGTTSDVVLATVLPRSSTASGSGLLGSRTVGSQARVRGKLTKALPYLPRLISLYRTTSAITLPLLLLRHPITLSTLQLGS